MHAFDPSAVSQPGPDDLPLGSNAMMLHLLVSLIGGEVDAYSEPVEPPEHLRLAVRAASTPILRGILLDAAIELDRRAPPEDP